MRDLTDSSGLRHRNQIVSLLCVAKVSSISLEGIIFHPLYFSPGDFLPVIILLEGDFKAVSSIIALTCQCVI